MKHVGRLEEGDNLRHDPLYISIFERSWLEQLDTFFLGIVFDVNQSYNGEDCTELKWGILG